jgi:hypothetical protein
MRTRCNRAREARRRTPLPARKSRLERGPDSERIRAFVIPGAAQASSTQPRLAGQAGRSGPEASSDRDTCRVGCRSLFNKLQRGDAGTGRQVVLATCGCSSVGRARPRQGRGHEFETRHPLHVGCVRAQAPVRRRACAWPRCGTRAAMRLVHRARRVWAQPTWIPLHAPVAQPVAAAAL